MVTPEGALGEGPFIYVALEESYFEIVPINATRLFAEWQAHLDPIARLRAVANRTLGWGLNWGWGRWFVEPSSNGLELVRRAAEDDEITTLLEHVEGTWVVDETPEPHSDVGKPVRDSILTRDELNGFEIALLLGMAVMAAVTLPIGYHGFQSAQQNSTTKEPGDH
jgi:hypothetical protein